MRWSSILAGWLCSMALLGTGATAAQAQEAKSPAAQSVTHLMLPPAPEALLPEAFAGWVARAAQEDDRCRPGRPGQRGGAQGVRIYGAARWPTTSASGETLSVHALRFQRRQRRLRRLFVLPAEWMAEGADRHGRHVGPQPGALLAGEHGGGREVFAHRADERPRSCASWPGSCPFRRAARR